MQLLTLCTFYIIGTLGLNVSDGELANLFFKFCIFIIENAKNNITNLLMNINTAN